VMTHTVARLIVAGAMLVGGAWSVAAASSQVRAAERFDVTKVADGVYLISRTEVLKQPLDGNTVVIVGAESVAVVDSTQTSTSAKAVIAEIRRLTPLPVKYLINTHWHNDHLLGNGAYVAAFPGVQIVAHELTREDIASEASAVLANRIRGLENRNQAQATLDAGRTPAGVPLSRADIHRLRERLAMPASHLEDLKAIVVTPPTVTYRGRMTLQLGGREVQLFSNGPGNTRSDTVVWLPADRVVASGDLLVSTVPFMSVSFPRGWLARLKEIEALAPSAILPGHGPVQRDLTWLHRHKALLESLITQVDAALDKGLTLDQTRASVNLSTFRDAYAGGDKFLVDEFDFRVTEPAVVDAYRERVGRTVPMTPDSGTIQASIVNAGIAHS
jgi:cyclase